jgi:hypothetical protein
MSIIGVGVGVLFEQILGTGDPVEIHDRILEDGVTKRIVENGGDDRETEGAP